MNKIPNILLVCLLGILVIASLFIEPTAAVAHESDSAELHEVIEPFSPAHRLQLYEQTKLSYKTALGYSLILPGLGNFYAEQYFVGGLAIVSLTFSAFFIAFGLNTSNTEFYWVGGGLALITYGGAAATSVYGVRRYNYRLQQSLNIFHPQANASDMKIMFPALTFRF